MSSTENASNSTEKTDKWVVKMNLNFPYSWMFFFPNITGIYIFNSDRPIVEKNVYDNFEVKSTYCI